MLRANLDSMEPLGEWEFRVSYVYESPCLKILKLRLEPGQRLMMDSEALQGKVSLLVLRGSGEYEGCGRRCYYLEEGDIVISEMSDPSSLLATDELSVLVTVATSQKMSCEVERGVSWYS